MSLQYAYNYAEINPVTHMCVGVYSGTVPSDDPNWIEIPVNDPEYCCKYYIDGNWYEDSEGQIPWTSALL